MTKKELKEYNWHIKLVQDRYKLLKLTFEQAEKIYHYEQDKDIVSDEYFSFWEEMDFEKATFQGILSAEQFATYEKTRQKMIADHEKQLRASDEQELKKIAYNQELLAYHQHTLIPSIKQNPIKQLLTIEKAIQNKAAYLQAEYKRLWQAQKKSILINNYRHHRLYMPNALKAALLEHDIICILPYLPYFEYQMDKPTEAIAQFIREKLKSYEGEYDEYFAEPMEKWHDFSQKAFDKYYGEQIRNRGWSITIEAEPENEKVEFLMRLVLMDIH